MPPLEEKLSQQNSAAATSVSLPVPTEIQARLKKLEEQTATRRAEVADVKYENEKLKKENQTLRSLRSNSNQQAVNNPDASPCTDPQSASPLHQHCDSPLSYAGATKGEGTVPEGLQGTLAKLTSLLEGKVTQQKASLESEEELRARSIVIYGIEEKPDDTLDQTCAAAQDIIDR